jgi:hypothetical protein
MLLAAVHFEFHFFKILPGIEYIFY